VIGKTVVPALSSMIDGMERAGIDVRDSNTLRFPATADAEVLIVFEGPLTVEAIERTIRILEQTRQIVAESANAPAAGSEGERCAAHPDETWIAGVGCLSCYAREA
jgi:hypothetical protein